MTAQINTTANTFTGPTTPVLAGNLLKLMLAKARMTTQQDGNLTDLFQTDALPNGMGTTWNSTKFGTLQAYSLTQGVDMTQMQALTGANVTVTPAEVGVQVVVTRKALAQWSEDVAEKAGVIMRQAMDRKKDADIAGLFAGFSRRVGAAGAAFSLGHITAGVAVLASGPPNVGGVAISAGNATNAMEGPFVFVVRPEPMHSLLRSLIGGPDASAPTVGTTSVGLSGGMADKFAREGQSRSIGMVGGASGYRNANLSKDTSDDSSGFIGARDAIVYVPMNYEGLGGIIKEVDESLRAYEIDYVEDYGFGELDDTHGVELLLDATAPTS